MNTTCFEELVIGLDPFTATHVMGWNHAFTNQLTNSIACLSGYCTSACVVKAGKNGHLKLCL